MPVQIKTTKDEAVSKILKNKTKKQTQKYPNLHHPVTLLLVVESFESDLYQPEKCQLIMLTF